MAGFLPPDCGYLVKERRAESVELRERKERFTLLVIRYSVRNTGTRNEDRGNRDQDATAGGRRSSVRLSTSNEQQITNNV
jgi:hypothetical protein